MMTNWVRAASLRELAEDMVIGVEIGGEAVALYNLEGRIYATDNICSHAFALLSDGYLGDGTIECPLHAARFDVKTGKVLCAPATKDIRTYPTRIEGEDILIDLD
ncbi:MAG TPA: non-heme iron oxygenase ferredoxin subunit [Aliidongia sp.]|nr:non-heme iron oxygenase ferredoxin subunit [Aliidongia sp.]